MTATLLVVQHHVLCILPPAYEVLPDSHDIGYQDKEGVKLSLSSQKNDRSNRVKNGVVIGRYISRCTWWLLGNKSPRLAKEKENILILHVYL